MIKLLCRLYDPTEGEILMDGINIKEYDYQQYMEVFAPVFQDFKLFSFSMIENQFEDLVKGKIAIYISHRLSSCQFCDKIAVFSDGNIKEYGTHAELVNKKDGIYAKMFMAQAQYYVTT